MTFVEGVPPSKHFRCITQRYVLRSPITQPNIPEEQVAYRQFPRPSPLPRRRGYARLVKGDVSSGKTKSGSPVVLAIVLLSIGFSFSTTYKTEAD